MDDVEVKLAVNETQTDGNVRKREWGGHMRERWLGPDVQVIRGGFEKQSSCILVMTEHVLKDMNKNEQEFNGI